MQTNNNNYERIHRKPPSKVRKMRDNKRSNRAATRKYKRMDIK